MWCIKSVATGQNKKSNNVILDFNPTNIFNMEKLHYFAFVFILWRKECGVKIYIRHSFIRKMAAEMKRLY